MRAWAWWVVAGAAACARELDPAACGARFEVQRDKIIRTEESREMGARYLSELDVGARAECLRLCCETDACDVFVYEEKGPGSCYLFDCGPPEDFRCKFTAHSNFSSGVLALSRRLAELQDAERRAQAPGAGAGARRGGGSASSTSSTGAPPPATAPPAALAPAPDHHAPRRCSRYQFECRRGGECIAVYNACDGVPQCADGSDEAPELGCPPGAPPSAPPAAPAERWPHRLAQAQPPHRYAESGGVSHIFSHKGGLLQEAEGGYAPFEPAAAPAPAPAAWPRRGWPQQPLGPESAWGGAGAEYAREWEPAARRAWPVPPAPAPDPREMAYLPAKTMPEVGEPFAGGAGAAGLPATLRDTAKKGPSPRAPPAAASTTAAPAPRPAPPVPRPAPPPRTAPPHARNEAATPEASAGAERHLAAADDHDGLSERPPAAVLLLVLGVALTAALGATLACRARAARRRLRRGKPLAHDADYLVNGMYL